MSNLSRALFTVFLLVTSFGLFASDAQIYLKLNKEHCFNGDGRFPEITEESISDVLNWTAILEEGCNIEALHIEGEITWETLQTFRKTLNTANRFYLLHESQDYMNFVVDSNGGLIEPALKIGEMVANSPAFFALEVPEESVCFSSCIFIYAAAEIRNVYGKVGIHRPFTHELDPSIASYSEYLSIYKTLTPTLKDYLVKFGVSPKLIDDMNVIPSDEIKILSLRQRNEYGLGADNIAAKEYRKALKIKHCGADYVDLERRFHAVISKCQNEIGFSDYSKCESFAKTAFPDFRGGRESRCVESLPTRKIKFF
ncbi:hypothetical protein BK026_06695 [Alteromonas sp. V450]|uniref:hypothetical protein n=1 Tax=Alteromonas sp. V450 TaxID=1912139 RepID=UPI0008FF5BFF|nr:hypothetical protein [Alteromonas sp. V450]OJF68501.1 hypothetical protein BK026_06695 [Alteromonas sp. V450]